MHGHTDDDSRVDQRHKEISKLELFVSVRCNAVDEDAEGIPREHLYSDLIEIVVRIACFSFISAAAVESDLEMCLINFADKRFRFVIG